MNYIRTLKRIRQDKTNYRKRAALLVGRHSFITIKVSNQNVSSQLLKPTRHGDIVISSAHSRELEKHGWKGSCNSMPACYLTGLLLAKKSIEKGATKAVIYNGKSAFTTRVAACLKGIVEGGINVPVSEESLPPDERITGQHIAEYASILKQDQQDYESRFSSLIKSGLKPEDYPSHFEQIRMAISGKPRESGKESETEEKERTSISRKVKQKKGTDDLKKKRTKSDSKAKPAKSNSKGGKKKN